MTALQLSLLIFALVAIAVVGFVSYRRNEAPRERARAGLAAYLRYGLAHPTRYQLMFGSTSPLASHPSAQQAGAETFDMLVEGARRFDAAAFPA